MDVNVVIKLQALWRGYKSRKGEIQGCLGCGYPMTIAPSTTPIFKIDLTCSWCAEERARALEREGYSDISGHLHRACYYCGDWVCPGTCEESEKYIPCCMCGADCEGGDYERDRFCSRRCMVGWCRD